MNFGTEVPFLFSLLHHSCNCPHFLCFYFLVEKPKMNPFVRNYNYEHTPSFPHPLGLRCIRQGYKSYKAYFLILCNNILEKTERFYVIEVCSLLHLLYFLVCSPTEYCDLHTSQAISTKHDVTSNRPVPTPSLSSALCVLTRMYNPGLRSSDAAYS